MPNARPNIVLFITGQQRGDCLGLDPCSPAVLQTPNLDCIARSGLHCTQAYAECPICVFRSKTRSLWPPWPSRPPEWEKAAEEMSSNAGKKIRFMTPQGWADPIRAENNAIGG